ncbi:hypothetical protein NUACC21_05180 [Scytonema sp. NUACC21]
MKPLFVQEVSCLTDVPDNSAITTVYEAIGDLVVRFPLRHFEAYASTLRRWLKQSSTKSD